MNSKGTSFDLTSGIDLNRTDVDPSIYMQEVPIKVPRIRRKRNSIIIVSLKHQMQKDSRFVTNLCSKSAKSKSIVLPTTTNKDPTLKIPSLSHFDLSSEISCYTPLQNSILRAVPTPMTIPKAKTPSILGKSTPIHLHSKKNKKSKVINSYLCKPSTKESRAKRIFRVSGQIESYRLSLSPKLRKRSLCTPIDNIKMFDSREILNIANGNFL